MVLESIATNIARTVITDSEGNYAVTPLDPGNYRVSAEIPGFQTTVREGLDLTVGQAAVRAGVSAYIVGGMSAERVRPIVDVAMARFEEFQALRQELDQAKISLAERTQSERAKGIGMTSRGVSEDEAYVLLRKLAMERNQRLAHVSENVIAMAELLI